MLYDAMIAYDHGPLRVSLNANNLFDKQFLNTCLARGDSGPCASVPATARC